ncbi:MAG TPA: hypothetical protein VFU73_13460, partial [Actinocrinis sp.]|nr:hypothetical protein [Actinocrinis sp.]
MNETAEGLRETVDRAARYIRAHGGEFDLARFAALTGGQYGGPGATGAAGPLAPPEPQNPDGGWAAPWSQGASSLDATCYLLDLL